MIRRSLVLLIALTVLGAGVGCSDSAPASPTAGPAKDTKAAAPKTHVSRVPGR